MKSRLTAAALLFLAASCLLQFSAVSTTGTDYRYMINPASLYRPNPGEASFLIVPYEEALGLFGRSDYDDCSKILIFFKELLFRRMLTEAPENYAVFREETGRIARIISEAFNTPYRLTACLKQMGWSREHLRMRLEENARFQECSRRVYGGDLSGDIVGIIENDIRWMEKTGDGFETGHHYDLLASYYFALKDDQTAYSYLAGAGDIFSRCGNKPAIAQHAGRMSEYFKRKGDMNKAEEYLMRSLCVARDMNDSYYTARAYSFLGSMRREQGCFFEAESLLSQSLEWCGNSNRIDCRSSQYISLARLYYEFGQPELSAYNLEKALNEIDTIRRNIPGAYSGMHNVYLENSIAVSLGTCLSLKARILQEKGEIENAVKTMQRTIPLIDRGLDKHMSAGLDNQLGNVYAAAGRFKDAGRHYLRALETSRTLDEKKEIAGNLVSLSRLYLKTGDIDKADDCALEAIRLASEAGDWMVHSAALHTSGLLEIKKGDAEKGYDFLRAAVGVFEKEYSARNSVTDRKAMEATLHGIYSDIFTLQAETFRSVDSLLWWAEIHRRSPAARGAGEEIPAGAMIRGVIADLSWIPPEAVVVQYVGTPDRLYIIATDGDGSVSMSVDIPDSTLDEKVARFHSLCSPPYRTAIESGAFPSREEIVAVSGELYDILVRPVSGSLACKRIVCIIPDGPLHHLPFHALIDPRDTPAFFAEKYDVITSGSLCCLHQDCTAEEPGGDQGFFAHPLLVGALEYSSLARRMFPQVVDLPGSAIEIGAAASLSGGETVLSGPAATKEEFFSLAPKSDLVLISTHTVDYPVFSGETALLLSSSPAVRSEMDLSRTILTANEIGNMDLSGSKLVVLSTCESTCGRTGSRNSGPGLAEAFARAGAGAVVSALWQIEDKAARSFVCGFLDELYGTGDIIGAVRSARMKAISEARIKGDLTADIAAWAPFTLLASFSLQERDVASRDKNE